MSTKDMFLLYYMIETVLVDKLIFNLITVVLFLE